jgi:hypothetical protein
MNDHMYWYEEQPVPVTWQCPACLAVFSGNEHVCLPTPAEAVALAEAWLEVPRG